MSYLAANLVIALIALLFERLIGYPDRLYRLVRHPVVWMGWLIGLSDRLLNRDSLTFEWRRLNGAFALFALLLATLIFSGLVSGALRALPGGLLIEALLATSLIAQKSLGSHVRAVAEGLTQGLEAGRLAVSKIVGRDPATLNESEIAKAAVESLAENTADGVIAPLFYLALFGLPGAALYKAVNTADSMIGHKSEKYRAFGFAAAKLDDIANYPTSRMTGGLFAIVAFFSRQWSGKAALRAMLRDADHHVSPNAGWPEAALAGALGLRLGGPRTYDSRRVDLATMGRGRATLTGADIATALALYSRSLSLTALILTAVTFIFLSQTF